MSETHFVPNIAFSLSYYFVVCKIRMPQKSARREKFASLVELKNYSLTHMAGWHLLS
jgi:hypothetical protein